MDRLLSRTRVRIRANRLSDSTEASYLSHLGKFLRFVHDQGDTGARPLVEDARRYLERLGNDSPLAPASLRAAATAVAFFLREVAGIDAAQLRELANSTRRRDLPSILNPQEVALLLSHLQGANQLIAELLYGSGLRLQECIRLRVEDIRLDEGKILVRNALGEADRFTVLPRCLKHGLAVQIVASQSVYEADSRLGRRPTALRGNGNARCLSVGFAFPGERVSRESLLSPRSHISEDTVQRAIRQAAVEAGLSTRTTCQTLRHSFAAHLIAANCDLRIVQRLLGHAHVRSTMVYLELVNRRDIDVISPLDTIILSAAPGNPGE